jgi:acetyl-CoA acetyltransferase
MATAMVVGAAMIRFGRHLDRSLGSMAGEALRGALADAGIAANRLGLVFFANAAAGLLTGQECIRGQVALRDAGVLGAPIVNVENACASGSSAFALGRLAIESGRADLVAVVGAEKMMAEDRSRAMRALEAAADLEELAALKRAVQAGGAGTGSIFMDLYASLTRDYMARSGATAADIAAVAAKNRRAGSLNPAAQFQDAMAPEAILASRMIADPLRLMMCSANADGAAALILASEAAARRLGVPAVAVRACVLLSGTGHAADGPVARTAALRAYDDAGIGPGELGAVELHDAAAPAELILSEQLGLCARGDGVALFRSGATTLGGRCPINPSGGLISRGHPIGATGCAQLVELVDQLRGRCGARQVAGLRTAMAENGGGWLGDDAAATVVTILAA